MNIRLRNINQQMALCQMALCQMARRIFWISKKKLKIRQKSPDPNSVSIYVY